MTISQRTIDRTSPLPIWQQIRDILLAEIRSGALADDGKLPPASRLAARLGVNRHTVRQALMALEEAGVTETRQGAGSFVVGRVVDYPISSKTRFSDIVLAQGMAPSGEILRTVERPGSNEVVKALGLKRGDRVIMVERACRADGYIVGIARHYFPAARFRELRDALKRTASISDALNALGVANYFRRSTTVSTRLPSSREARLLRQSAARPVLVTKSVNVDAHDRPIEFGTTLFLADRVQLRFSN